MSFESSLILCSTPRLARSLQTAYQEKQMSDGAVQWQAPIINTLSEWLNTTIETAVLCGEINSDTSPTNVLSATQEALLWEQSIAHHLQQNDAADLFDTAGLASAAMEANRLFTEWHLTLDQNNLTEETQQFLKWREHFQGLCAQANVLEAVRFEQWQIQCLADNAGQLPTQIQLAGFDRFHPNLIRLIQVLKKRGVIINTYPTTLDKPADLQQIKCNNQDEECRTAVNWARNLLEQNPDAKIAIVGPELDTLRDNLSNLLDDIFHPESVAPAFVDTPRCYDFTIGVPLSSMPIINTALNLLRFAWQKQSILQSDIAALLNSAYWSASHTEADARAKLDARMRQQLPLSIKNYRFLRFVAHSIDGEHALSLDSLLSDTDQLLGKAQENNRKQTAAVWAEVFLSALRFAHWPGERQLSSVEYQAVQSFERVLQQLASLDGLIRDMRAHEAIKRLMQLCRAQIFQPERKAPASIQLMGMLEAVAEPLDAIWVMGMNDHIWPPIARHNALLPADIQRQAGTPNASSEVQAEFADAIHQRLTHSARQVIFSSAMKDDQRQLRISPLIQNIPTLSVSLEPAQTMAETLAVSSTKDWQWVDDHLAPAVQEGEHVSGGTGLLKAQAICPAWAFYQYRLNIRKLDDPVSGLDVMERGNLVHAVLAAFWQGRCANDLQNTSAQQLESDLLSISNKILAAFNLERDRVYSDRFIALEAERLTKLVFAWLTEVEMLRPQGFTVSACEQSHNIDIEGISIKLIIDRIDTLADGRLLIIDYKTGRQLDFKNWANDQITEPQLPIYAAFILEGADVGAVCYAKIRAADYAFSGIAAAESLIQGATIFDDKRGRKVFDEAQFPNWTSIVQHWQKRIRATALDLKDGNAAVRYDDESQLAFCDVIPLLRLPERQLQYEYAHKEK